MSKRLALSALFLLSLNATASEVVLDKFQLWSTTNGDDLIRVIPTGTAVVANGCSDPDSYFVKSTLSETVKDRIYNTLLSAKLSKQAVTIKLSGCETNRPAIDTVIIL